MFAHFEHTFSSRLARVLLTFWGQADTVARSITLMAHEIRSAGETNGGNLRTQAILPTIFSDRFACEYSGCRVF